MTGDETSAAAPASDKAKSKARAPGRGGTRREWFVWGLAAIGVGMTASLVNVLNFHGYPMLSPEVGIAWAMLMGGALVFAGLMGIAPFGVRVVLGGLLALLLADWNMADYDWPYVIGVASFLLTYRLGLHFLKIVTIAFAVIGVTTLVGLGETAERIETVETDRAARSADGEAPPLFVHVILDEMEGVRGMNALRGQDRAGDRVADALVASGFTVYEDAYSPYYRSANSIPHFLNYGSLGESVGDGNTGVVTGEVAWLRDLAERGYRTEVIQSTFLDMCTGNAVANCRTYWRENLNGLREAELDAVDRARLILIHIGRQLTVALLYSVFEQNLVEGRFVSGDVSGHAPLKHRGEANTLNSVSELERVAEVVRGKGAGDAVIAHVLAPHFPFAHDADCRAAPLDRWSAGWETSATLEERSAAYMAQVTCLVGLIGEVAEAADEASGGRYVMVVNGDHGSRIGEELLNYGLDKGSDEDRLHGASALFAVKLLDPEPGRVAGIATLASLFGQVAGDGAVAPAPDNRPAFMLDPPRPDGKPVDAVPLGWE